MRGLVGYPPSVVFTPPLSVHAHNLNHGRQSLHGGKEPVKDLGLEIEKEFSGRHAYGEREIEAKPYRESSAFSARAHLSGGRFNTREGSNSIGKRRGQAIGAADLARALG